MTKKEYMESCNLVSFAPGKVHLKGPLGKAISLSVKNRLKKIDYSHLVDPFRFRNEHDDAWRCEFWGKIVRSLILSQSAVNDPELSVIIRNTVKDMLSTQTPDGCISSYPVELQTGGWDIWGRKYVLTALLRYHDLVEKDPCVRNACERMVDHLMKQVAPDKKNILDCGCHDGLAASSILSAVLGLYRICGKRKYLDYARWIADTGCSEKHNIFKAACASVPPGELANGKAYEMMSCFQGLLELYREVPDPVYFQAVKNFYRMVRDREIFITGVGGLKDIWGEYWDDGKLKQCRNDAGTLGETCVTTTWIHYCERMLRLTEDSTIADEMEVSLYNGILGAMKPDGTAWIHGNPTPLNGNTAWKRPAQDQILRGFQTPFDGHDCCLAQGPEALAMALPAAAFLTGTGPKLNFYEDMDITFQTPGANHAKLSVSGGYPFQSTVRIAIFLPEPETFSLQLRIPAWQNPEAGIIVCGKHRPAVPGSYLVLTREWKNNDVVEIAFDLSPKLFRDPGGSGRVAFRCGSIVLAQDSRLTKDVDIPVPECTTMKTEKLPGFQLVWKLADGTRLCDYASAGNLFREDNTLCVWMRSGFGDSLKIG